MIVVLFPARPVVTAWETCLPPRMTVTESPLRALVGTLTPSAWETTTSAEALMPGRRSAVVWSSWNVTS